MSYGEEFSQRKMRAMYASKTFTDIEFKVQLKNGDEQRIVAHKYILAASSSIFSAMFFGDLKESGPVDIVDASAEAFEEFVQLFYGGHSHLTLENASEVLKLADKYDVLGFYRGVRDVCEHINEFLASDGFLESGENVIKYILDFDDLKRDEVEIFDMAVDWAKSSLERKGMDASNERICAELEIVRGAIRFPIMALKEFIAVIKQYPTLLAAETVADIMGYITQKQPLTSAKMYKIKPRLKTVEMQDGTFAEPDHHRGGIEPIVNLSVTAKKSNSMTRLFVTGFEVLLTKSKLQYIDKTQRCVVESDQLRTEGDLNLLKYQETLSKFSLDLDSKLPILCNGSKQELTVSLSLKSCYETARFKKVFLKTGDEENNIEVSFVGNNYFISKIYFEV